MVGQVELVNSLFSQPLSKTHKTILLLGEYGCGKHTLAEELANHFSLPLVDITDIIDVDTLEEIRLRSTPTFYLISVDKLTERSQNSILKFIEEPGLNSYIILIADSKYGILDTILNRCVTYEFKPYTASELSEIVGEEIAPELLAVCKTPGQIKVTINNYSDLVVLCDTIVSKLNKASFSNTMSIVDKINYKDEYDKFDLRVFLRLLMNKLYLDYLTTNNNRSLILYNIIDNESQKLVDNRLNKEIFMQHLLTKMWKGSRI